MPQGAISAAVATQPTTRARSAFKAAPLQLGAAGELLVGKGTKSLLNITAEAATEIAVSASRICKVIVNTAASAAGGIYDSATTGGVGTTDLVFAIPQTVGIYDVDMPLTAGLAIVVGTGGVVSLSYM